MDECEPLAELFLKKLNSSRKPVPVLITFYKVLFDLDTIPENIYSAFYRLNKVYGKDLIFFSLLDVSDMNNFDVSMSPIGIITYFAKKRLEKKYKMFPNSQDLDSLAKQVEGKLNRKRMAKVKVDPFEEEENGEE